MFTKYAHLGNYECRILSYCQQEEIISTLKFKINCAGKVLSTPPTHPHPPPLHYPAKSGPKETPFPQILVVRQKPAFLRTCEAGHPRPPPKVSFPLSLTEGTNGAS